MKKTLSIVLFLIIVALGITGASLLFISQPSNNLTTTPTNIATRTIDTDEVLGARDTADQLRLDLTAQIDGQTALELLETSAKIETEDYGLAGKFVTSINGVESDSKNFWAFYLNGEFAAAGASQTILEAGDTISFVYEEILFDN